MNEGVSLSSRHFRHSLSPKAFTWSSRFCADDDDDATSNIKQCTKNTHPTSSDQMRTISLEQSVGASDWQLVTNNSIDFQLTAHYDKDKDTFRR